MVEYHEITPEGQEGPNVRYVLASDYDALAAELAELKPLIVRRYGVGDPAGEMIRLHSRIRELDKCVTDDAFEIYRLEAALTWAIGEGALALRGKSGGYSFIKMDKESEDYGDLDAPAEMLATLIEAAERAFTAETPVAASKSQQKRFDALTAKETPAKRPRWMELDVDEKPTLNRAVKP